MVKPLRLAGVVSGLAAILIGAVLAGSALLERPGSGVEPSSTTAAAASDWSNPQFPLGFDDPVGDATDTGAGGATTMAACALGSAATGTCVGIPAMAPAAGTPGPHYDITRVSIEDETSTHVSIVLTIASLSEDLSELDPGNGFYRMNHYRVCWAVSEDGGCDRIVVLDVMKRGETLHMEPKLEIRSAACNEWSWCSWGIDAEFTPGTPATIRFNVPKTYLGTETGIHHISAETGWIAEPQVFPAWHPGVTLRTPAYHIHHHGGAVAGIAIADVTEPFPVGIALRPNDVLPTYELTAPLLPGHAGNNHGASGPYDYPEMDILWFDVHEDAGDVVAVFAIREFETLPTYDFDYSVGIGIAEYVWEIGYRHEGARYYGYSGRCIMEMCQDGDIITPTVELVHGAPGLISIRTPLDFIDNPSPGTATNLFWAMSMYSDVNYYYGSYEDDVFGDYHSVFMIDSLVGGAPFVFGSGHKADWTDQVHSTH